MGDNYRQMEQYTDAINSYTKAIEIDETYREPYLLCAEVCNILGYYQVAIDIVKKSIEVTTRHYNWVERVDCWREKPYDILALSYYNLEDGVNAYINGLVAYNMNPNDERIKNNLKYYKEVFERCVEDTDGIKLLLDQYAPNF